MQRFRCSSLGIDVELTDEREEHIAQRHPDLLPDHVHELRRTVEEPDDVMSAFVGSKSLLIRWVDTLRGGRYLVVVVVSDDAVQGRHWIVTAYLTRRAPQGI
jgi:hypothetical protein